VKRLIFKSRYDFSLHLAILRRVGFPILPLCVIPIPSVFGPYGQLQLSHHLRSHSATPLASVSQYRTLLTGHRSKLGLVSMSQSKGDFCSRLLQELSVIPDSTPSTPPNAPSSQTTGGAMSSMSLTPSASSSTSTIMTPVFLTQVINAAIQDTLHPS
jgi:hypothetical protein